ncbi:MAG: site-specific integrase [Lachnospiraceae bacterium]|nr:site-specific integrase [Lachnospiraceae bacterium]
MPHYSKRKDGRYETAVFIGYDKKGKKIYKHLYAKSKNELERKKAEVLLNKTSYLRSSDVLFGDYANRWLKLFKANKSPKTYDMYQSAVNNYLLPSLGMLKLKDVQKSDIQNLVNENYAKQRTCEIIVLTIKQILEFGCEEEILSRNVCKGIDKPKKKESKKRALTKEETAAILSADFTEREKAFILILYYCGLRRGEALALTRKDINFKTGLLTVNKAITYVGNDAILKDPKSKAGNRSVPMPEALQEVLKLYLKKNKGLYLFTCADGSIITKSAFRVLQTNIIKKVNAAMGGNEHLILTDITPHILRHNYCCLLYYGGVSIKETAKLLGHADTKMVLEVYSHLDEEREQTQSKLNQIFNAEKQSVNQL